MRLSQNELRYRVLIPCLIGNALEFYDFTLCGVFLSILGKNFFPTTDDFAILLGGIFAFSAAFWTRPLGALVFGYIGDKFGRKVALSLSVLLMGIPTLIIGCLPDYESIGLIAPCVLLTCRLMQGLCTGGEYNGAAVFALEHMKIKPGKISGMISASCVVGAVSATLMAHVVANFLKFDQAWRIPFLMGAGIAVIGFILRKRATETMEFLHKQKINRLPFFEIIKKYPKQYMLSIAAGAFNGILSYTLFGFLNIYLTQYIGVKTTSSLFFNIFGLFAFMISCLVFGSFADKIQAKNSMLLAGLLAIIASWSGFLILQTASDLGIVVGQILIGVGVGAFVGPCHIFLQEKFTAEVRYTGIASGFSIGMAITGGSTALIMTYLLQHTQVLLAPAMYISSAAVIWILLLLKYNR